MYDCIYTQNLPVFGKKVNTPRSDNTVLYTIVWMAVALRIVRVPKEPENFGDLTVCKPQFYSSKNREFNKVNLSMHYGSLSSLMDRNTAPSQIVVSTNS